jgi:hypothetical protein
MPRDADVQLDLDFKGNQLYGLYYYVTHNFDNFLSLAVQRLKLFFIPTRYYYSRGHNLFLFTSIMLFYGSIILSTILWYKKNKMLFNCIFLLVLTVASSAALQCDDYHSRFFMSILPLLVVLVSFLFSPYCKKASETI